MTRFVLNYDPLIGKHRLDAPTKDITNRTVGAITDLEAAEWLAGLVDVLRLTLPHLEENARWHRDAQSRAARTEAAFAIVADVRAVLKGAKP